MILNCYIKKGRISFLFTLIIYARPINYVIKKLL